MPPNPILLIARPIVGRFQAEVTKLLDIVVHSLYSDRQIFLRELISNASDACDKLRYEALTTPALREGAGDFRITLKVDKDARTLTVHDNGIGMTREEVSSTSAPSRSPARRSFSARCSRRSRARCPQN